MKSVDLNLIKFDRLFQNPEYLNIYENSKQYENLLPVGMKLYNLYLKNYLNYEVTEKNNKFSPNLNSSLAILIGCREHVYSGKGSGYGLCLYFHILPFNAIYAQEIFSMSLYRENKDHCYFKNSVFMTLDSINCFKDSHKNLITDYLVENNILSKLSPNEKDLRNTYIDRNFIEVPF